MFFQRRYCTLVTIKTPSNYLNVTFFRRRANSSQEQGNLLRRYLFSLALIFFVAYLLLLLGFTTRVHPNL